jgi:chromosome segregation ATPase
MVKKPEEILANLQKQKEDIEILLSSLEEAYSEAGITEKHYKEVKTKNSKKLKELGKKINTIRTRMDKQQKKEEKKLKAKTKAKIKKELPPLEKKPKSVGEMIAAEQGEIPVAAVGEGESVPGTPAGVPAEPAPFGQESPVAVPVAVKPGDKKHDSQDIKDMLSKFIKEIKPGGLEVLPRVEKVQIQIEKMQAFLDAMKDDKTSRDEIMRRLTEEIGELRSSVNSLDRKVSQQEILVGEVNTSVTDLKPQKFVKFLKKQDMQVKVHDSKIQRMEDLTTVITKRLSTVEDVLKKIGGLEKIADFGRDIAKRLVDIENREKRIGRISDKIDSIFIELNKRMDEFMLYKAKQDTLDELSREMMKAIDDMNTKIEKYAEKEDLDMLRDTMDSRMASVATSAGPTVSPEVMKLTEQKEEIEGLLGMLEEQFKKGDLKQEEYEKAKTVNTERIESISKKIEAAKKKIDAVPEAPGSEPMSWTDVKSAEPEPIGNVDGTKLPGKNITKPESPETGEEETKKVPEKPKTKKPFPAEKPTKQVKSEKPDRDKMLKDLEESLKKGDITKGVFESVKQKLFGKKKDK